jgi:hypothetical protein
MKLPTDAAGLVSRRAHHPGNVLEVAAFVPSQPSRVEPNGSLQWATGLVAEAACFHSTGDQRGQHHQ